MRKPLTGAILGILIGVAAAIFLARQGIWPLDQITLFFLPGILGLLGLLVLSMGRPSQGVFTFVVALLILVPILVWGALGFGAIDENGVLNGGCTVTAESAIDTTTVTDTSRGDPFRIDPDGGLHWSATSPSAFQDYEWEVHVVVGGIPVTIDSDREANEAGDQDNDGDVDNIRSYADARGFDIDTFRGVYEVGGSAATCNGFGFVEIEGEGLDTIGMIALIVMIVLLIILIILIFVGRETVSVVTESAGAGELPDGSGSDQNGLEGGSSDS